MRETTPETTVPSAYFSATVDHGSALSCLIDRDNLHLYHITNSENLADIINFFPINFADVDESFNLVFFFFALLAFFGRNRQRDKHAKRHNSGNLTFIHTSHLNLGKGN